MLRILVLAAFNIIVGSNAFGQNAEIVQEKVFTSQTLSGHVQLGSNPAGLKSVAVEICRVGWKRCILSTVTDEDGSFSFANVIAGALYSLKLSMPGTNTLLVRVRIRKTAPRQLTLNLSPAT